jgi:hypothetical protein
MCVQEVVQFDIKLTNSSEKTSKIGEAGVQNTVHLLLLFCIYITKI